MCSDLVFLAQISCDFTMLSIGGTTWLQAFVISCTHVSRKGRYDQGNVTADNALVGLMDESKRKRSPFLGPISFPKTAQTLHRCVTMQQFTFGSAYSIFCTELLQRSHLYNNLFCQSCGICAKVFNLALVVQSAVNDSTKCAAEEPALLLRQFPAEAFAALDVLMNFAMLENSDGAL